MDHQVEALAKPPGLRFRPNDEEVISYYLMNKVNNLPLPVGFENYIPEVNFYQYNPQELIAMHSSVESEEWYFFSPRESDRIRPHRSAKGGFWKTTAKDKPVDHMGSTIGYKRVLDFYEDGQRTDYKMHEYVVERITSTTSKSPTKLKDWVVNKIYTTKWRAKRTKDDDKSSRLAKKAKKINDEKGEQQEDRSNQLSNGNLNIEDECWRITNQDLLPSHFGVPNIDVRDEGFPEVTSTLNEIVDPSEDSSSNWLDDLLNFDGCC